MTFSYDNKLRRTINKNVKIYTHFKIFIYKFLDNLPPKPRKRKVGCSIT